MFTETYIAPPGPDRFDVNGISSDRSAACNLVPATLYKVSEDMGYRIVVPGPEYKQAFYLPRSLNPSVSMPGLSAGPRSALRHQNPFVLPDVPRSMKTGVYGILNYSGR